MKKSLLLIALSLLLLVTACGGTDDAEGGDQVIKIGALHPLSGGLAHEGQEMRDAAKLAADQINESGGIKSLDGAKIQIVEADHEGAPEKGVSEVQSLDSKGVVGIIGTYASGVALPATQEAERSQIPFVVDIGSANEITERGFKYTYRLQPPATEFSVDFLKYFEALNEASDQPLKTVALIHEDSVFGSSIAKAIKEEAKAHGFEVVLELPHASDAADLSSSINRITSTKPDIVAATTYLRDGTMLVEGLNNAGFAPKALVGVANGAFSNADFIKDEKLATDLIMDVNYTVNPKSEEAQKVREAFKENYSKNLGPNAAYSYMAVQVIADAVERAGSSDRTAINEALKETNLTEHILPQAAIEFDETGQNVNAKAVLNQIFEHEIKVVYPEEYQETEPVYPAN